MIEYRLQLTHKFPPRCNFPLLRWSSLQRLFSCKVHYHWTIKTCDSSLLWEYLLQVYFGICIHMISRFLLHPLSQKDIILVYQIWWRRSQLSKEVNHFIRLVEFFHWFAFSCCIIILQIFSSFCLPNFPNSLPEVLIRPPGNFELKFSLWSLSVMKAGFLAKCSILPLSSTFLAIYWLPC